MEFYRSQKAFLDDPSYGPMPENSCVQRETFWDDIWICATEDYILTYDKDPNMMSINNFFQYSGDVKAVVSKLEGLLKDFKDGKLRVYKDNGKNKERDLQGEWKIYDRTEQCIKHEGWFEVKLEDLIDTVKESRGDGYHHRSSLTRP